MLRYTDVATLVLLPWYHRLFSTYCCMPGFVFVLMMSRDQGGRTVALAPCIVRLGEAVSTLLVKHAQIVACASEKRETPCTHRLVLTAETYWSPRVCFSSPLTFLFFCWCIFAHNDGVATIMMMPLRPHLLVEGFQSRFSGCRGTISTTPACPRLC